MHINLNTLLLYTGIMMSGAFIPASVAEELPRWQLNMPQGVTEISRDIYGLHMAVLWVCVVIGVIVFGAMFISMVLHHRSRNKEAATFHENFWVEVAWTTIPAIILIILFIPSMRTISQMYDTQAADIDILVTGFQWKWKYEYLGEDVKFFSNLSTPSGAIYGIENKNNHYLLDVDEPLVVPLHKKIRFLITANDVLHAWWVPAFAVKQDAIPGFINEAWARIEEPGTYRGQCAELCGKDHGFMPIVVKAVSDDEYRSWLAERKRQTAQERTLMAQQFSLEQLVERGEKVYQSQCMVCHNANGKGIPGAFPSLVGTAISTGLMNDHIDIVVNGRAGTTMQAFGSQLSPLDLAAVITYERNAWGNNMGDMVQAIDIARFINDAKQ